MINLPQFLKTIDQTTAAMPKEELAAFIHDIARTLPEIEREDFLARLIGTYGNTTSPKPQPKIQEPASKEDFTQKHSSLKAQLERIESWDMALEGCLNQDYDDWYDSADEEFRYSDPEGVVDIIQEACTFVHRCIDCEEYGAARELTDILIGLDIMVGGEYQEYTDTPINISDLQYYHLGNVDYKSLIIDAAHAAYCVSELLERADHLYNTLSNSGRKDITLEMIMQSGRELPEMDAFLPLWIEYLGGMTTSYAQKLLQEALELTGDGDQLLASARKYCGDHPELYEQYLSGGLGNTDAASLLAVGTEALEAIDKKYLVRSRIALLTSQIALELDRPELAEDCWLEAFRSDTRVVNYLRLFMECRDFSKVRETAAQIYRKACSKLPKDSYFYPTAGGGRENQVNPTDAYMLAFLGGEFGYVRENAMKAKDSRNSVNSLGWSASFMKCGLAAFLLLLTEDIGLPPAAAPSGTLLPGAREMLRRIVEAVKFDKAEYENGILKAIHESSEEWFLKCWLRWKKTVPLSNGERTELLEWAESLVTKRVKGIMEGNHRNYYGECAAYIAALGEAKESGGEPDGKQATMLKYMEAYNRRSAFRQEMRSYGMRDDRKKK